MTYFKIIKITIQKQKMKLVKSQIQEKNTKLKLNLLLNVPFCLGISIPKDFKKKKRSFQEY